MIQRISGTTQLEKLEAILTRTQMESKDVLDRVDGILADVRRRGDEAVLEYSRRYDGHQLDQLKVTEREFEEARRTIDPALKRAIEHAIEHITAFHKNQIDPGFTLRQGDDILLGQRVRPIDRAGIYVPGGTASYPSTVMMNVIPANLAGVREIILATPADAGGRVRDSVLVAADLLGVTQIWKMGGAQAVGALCYGTQTIPAVDKIVGPGNIYVAMAKRKVSGLVGIDMIAGPSEVVIVADGNANPRFIAADLIAQAEHDVRAAGIVITDSPALAGRIEEELARQLASLERRDIASEALDRYGAILLARDMDQAFVLADRLAPEHLEILTEDPFADSEKVRHAGAIFLGEYSPEPVGDYYAGPNHTLPTSRTARFSSALGVYDFCKKTSLIYYSKKALEAAADDIITLAADEALTGHAHSIRVRLEETNV